MSEILGQSWGMTTLSSSNIDPGSSVTRPDIIWADIVLKEIICILICALPLWIIDLVIAQLSILAAGTYRLSLAVRVFSTEYRNFVAVNEATSDAVATVTDLVDVIELLIFVLFLVSIGLRLESIVFVVGHVVVVGSFLIKMGISWIVKVGHPLLSEVLGVEVGVHSVVVVVGSLFGVSIVFWCIR
jgi:hypothetical protein